jgi:acyl carrier protein
MVLPRSELEAQLAGIWAEILDIDQIGIDQDVFALGVDSLAMMQMIMRVEEHFGADFTFKDIFDAPTVAALALRVETSRKGSTGLVRSSRDPPTEIARVKGDGPWPLSVVQERMMRIERELPGLPQFNLRFAHRLRGPLNVLALERSLAEVVRRHGSLRTGFAWLDGLPAALITPAKDIKSSLIVEDLASLAPVGNSRAKALLLRKAELAAEQERLKLIDTKHAPLFRARLLRLSADDHVLVLIVHDIIIDGWSMEVFIEELLEFYAGFITGKQTQLPEPVLHFSDFVRWQRLWSTSDAATRQLSYWKNRLRKASPVFGAKDDVADELAARVVHERFHISNDLMARLNDLGHSRGATLFMTLLTCFKTLLLLRSGRNDICVGTTMANRSQLGRERMIGPFANTTLIRTQFDADLTFQEALDRVRDAVLEAYARQELPFDIIAARLAEEEGLDPASLVQFYFVLQVAFRRRIKLHDVAVQPFGYREGKSALAPIDRTWLRMSLNNTPSGITGVCRCKNDLFERMSARHWIADYKAILTEAVTNPRKSIGRLDEG